MRYRLAKYLVSKKSICLALGCVYIIDIFYNETTIFVMTFQIMVKRLGVQMRMCH